MMLKTMVSTVMITPSRSGVCGSPAARNAPLSMKNMSMPKMPMNIARRNGKRLGLHIGRGVHQTQQRRRRGVTDRGQQDRQAKRGQERLIDDAIDLVGFVRSGKPRHEHGHTGECRADEDNDDEDDLPADADGGVGGVADEVADHRVVDDALQTGDDVLQHRRPGQPPDGWANRTLDNRPVELPELAPGVGHRNGSVLRRTVASPKRSLDAKEG